MSPTAPTFVTLNNELNKAHGRIRELEARETELVAHNRTLCAVMEELTNADHPRKTADITPSSDKDSDGGLSTGDHLKHPRQRPGPTPQPPRPAVNPTSPRASATGTSRVKTRRFPYV